MREITTTEPFLEAWPSIIIMTIIFLFAQWGEDKDKFYDYCRNNMVDPNYPNRYLDNECNEYLDYQPFNYQPPNYCTNHPENDQCAVYGGFGGGIWFFASYTISIIAASIGITKFLQVGPFSVLSSEGTLNGMCKCRFFLAFVAVLTSIFSKGLFIAINVVNVIADPIKKNVSALNEDGTRDHVINSGSSYPLFAMLVFIAGLSIIPNFLFSLISIYCSTGINKKFQHILLGYPAAWMLPIATYFVIGPRKSSCFSKTNYHKHQLGFSNLYTILNSILTIMMYAIITSYFAADPPKYPLAPAIFIQPVFFLSLIFNIAFLSVNEQCCCKRSRNCLRSCCCDSKCYQYETYVIDSKTVQLKIVKIDD